MMITTTISICQNIVTMAVANHFLQTAMMTVTVSVFGHPLPYDHLITIAFWYLLRCCWQHPGHTYAVCCSRSAVLGFRVRVIGFRWPCRKIEGHIEGMLKVALKTLLQRRLSPIDPKPCVITNA